MSNDNNNNNNNDDKQVNRAAKQVRGICPRGGNHNFVSSTYGKKCTKCKKFIPGA